MDEKPWAGRIPEADVKAFEGSHLGGDRPISAGDQPALLIVDMTYNFVDGRYPLGWGETGGPAVEANRVLLREAREFGISVFFTKMFENPDYESTPAERGRWKHQEQGWGSGELPSGDRIVEELAPAAGETIICKGWKPSPFFGTTLASQLIWDRVDTLVVTGMTTSGCVRAAVLDAFQYNLAVIVPHEACADRSQISHAVNLFDLHMKYADVVSLDETVDYLRSVAGRVEATVEAGS
jgi:nicotinamidase-related amidase